MRNLYELDNSGMAVSKGHGFVTFTQHRHTLEALRNINNNPDIFTSKKRPVVEFSLENKGALKAKASRMQKSRDHNIVGKVPDLGPKEVSRAISKENSSFMGSNYDPKIKGMKALHSHIGPKIRHKDSKNLKKGGKITRNKINNQLRNARALKRKRNGPKMKANQKSVTKASFITKAKNSGQKTTDSTKKPKTKKRKFI